MHRALVSGLRLPRWVDTSTRHCGPGARRETLRAERAHLVPVLARALWGGIGQ